MTNTEKKLIELAASRFGRSPEKLSPDDDLFESLGIDSYKAMDLVTELEDSFDVELPDYEVQGVNTFAGLAAAIDRRL